MDNRRLMRCLFSLIGLLSLTSGCQVLHAYRPVSVLVRDAETKKPIAEAEVALEYPVARDSLAPASSSGLTGADGIARLHAAPYGYALLVSTSAHGYLPENEDLPTDVVQKIEMSHWLESAERRPTSLVVEMYAEPRFSAELIVPSSYHGLVRARILTSEEASFPAGQRCFRYRVPASGVVEVRGPAPLQRLSAPDFRARIENGPLLGEKMDFVKVGFRWLAREGNEHLFVVGTLSDYEVFRRRYAPREGGGRPPPPAPEPAQPGHGRGGHR